MRIYQPYWIAFCKAKNIPLDNTCKMLNFIEYTVFQIFIQMNT